jgi:3-hydroxyisobutyrate dehydrogenase-like beta-hydroxyacid dehydrogenase
MELHTIGILSPGDMGHAIGRVLRQQGVRVLTSVQGRSVRTAALAASAGITAVEDDETLVREAQILLSILPPSQATALAERVARAVKQSGTSLLFADCNAIAPRTVQAIEQVITRAGASFVDVGIIGSPPRPGAPGPRLYASGPGAQELAQLQAYGLDVRILSSKTGQASGLKMCYASLTKGLTALAGEAFMAGDALGVGETLTAELGASQDALLKWFRRQVPGMPPKAARWIREMEEIAQAWADLGLPPQMLEGAAAVYRFVGKTELSLETPEQRQRGQTLEEVTAILAAALSDRARDL